MSYLVSLFQNIVFQTVLAGVLVFVFSEIIQRFLLVPFQKYKEVVGKIDNRLKFYANVATNPGNLLPREITLECSKALRELSCELEATYKQIPFKKVSSRQKISDAAGRLIRLSNSLGPSATGRGLENSKDMEKIREDLDIKEL